MKEEPTNYQVQRSFFDRVWHQEEERAIYDLFDGEAGGIDPIKGVNPDTYRPWYRGMLRHLGGVRIEIVHFLEQEDRMALKFILRGTSRKSGNPVIWKGSGFGRYAGGKIVSASNYLDHLSLFAQLDLLPEQAMQDALADESLFWEVEQAIRQADEQKRRPDPWLLRCGAAPAQSIFLMPGPDLKVPGHCRFEAAVEELLPKLPPEVQLSPGPVFEIFLPEESQLEVLLQAYSCAMVVVDLQDRILEMNSTFTEFVDGELVNCLGKAFCDLLEADEDIEENRLFGLLCSGRMERYEHVTRLRGRAPQVQLLATRVDRLGAAPLVVRCLRWCNRSTATDLLAFQAREQSLLVDRLQQKLAHQLASLWVHLQSQPAAEAAEREVHERCLHLIERMSRELSGRVPEIFGAPKDCPELSLALEQLLTDYEQECGLRVTLELETQLGCLRGVSALFVYRIVQEGLRNVVRHAGVKRAEVRLSLAGEHIQGLIRDEGSGFTPGTGTGRLGLVGMRERCLLLQGDLSISSQPGCGTSISFALMKG